MRASRLLIASPFAALLWVGAAVAQPPGLLPEPPADAKPGECYGLLYVPPQVRNVEERKLVAEAGERSELVPAVYETVEQQVTLPAGKRRKVVVPAVTETVEKTITVSGTRRVAVPARYRTVEEQVTVAQGTQLKTGKLLDGEGEAICLVDDQTTQTVKKRVLDRPATTKLVETGPRERVVKQKKVVTPAVTELVAVPERTVTRRVKRLVTPASTRLVPVAARYETVTRQEVTSPARAEWQRVLCETNVTPALVQSLQEALRREGEYQGRATGAMNPQTVSAVRRYQEKNRLPSGSLGLSTLASLGVDVGEGQTQVLRDSVPVRDDTP